MGPLCTSLESVMDRGRGRYVERHADHKQVEGSGKRA